MRLRKTLTRYGDDVGAATIAQHLARNPRITKVPAESTIWRILTRRGFTTAQPQKRPRCSWIRPTAEEPNELWQAACRCPSSLCIPSAPTPCPIVLRPQRPLSRGWSRFWITDRTGDPTLHSA